MKKLRCVKNKERITISKRYHKENEIKKRKMKIRKLRLKNLLVNLNFEENKIYVCKNY